MENNKYYTPQIEEFCVGFEYEINQGKISGWEKENVSLNTDLSAINFHLTNNDIRAKLLNEEDILDCGFTQISNDCFNLPIKKYRGRLNQEVRILVRQTVLIYLAMDFNDKDNLVLFTGHIKNKNELLKLLKQLEIC